MPISALFISLVIIGIIMGLLSIKILFGYIAGLALGSIIMLLIIRRLGKASHHSQLSVEVFHKLTLYRARVYNIERIPINITVTTYGENDTNDLVEVLKGQMGFPAAKVKDALAYIAKTFPNKPLEEKLREALKYLDSENNYKTVTKEA